MLADAQPSCYVHQRMNTYRDGSNAQACGAQVASEASTRPQYQQIKLALDVHAASVVVGRMIDGAKVQPPQTFKPADFLAWAKKQVALAKEVSRNLLFARPHVLSAPRVKSLIINCPVFESVEDRLCETRISPGWPVTVPK